MYKNLLVKSEQIINFLNTTEEHKNGLRNQFNEFVSGHLRNKEKMKVDELEKVIMRSEVEMKEFFRRNANIRIIKSDKSKKLVVMDKSLYYEKMMELLNDKNVYRKLKTSPGKYVHTKVEKYLDNLVKCKLLDKRLRNNLRKVNYIDTRIEGLLKTHKEHFL